MNATQFVDNLSERMGSTKKDADKALKAVLAEIGDCLAKGEKISFIGFGAFEVSDIAARKGRNPQTGEEITIPASKRPVFKAGKELKEKVQK